MGLAEPKKRIKLSHDPRNLQWSQATDSFGARIMQSSGWKPGTALGASSVPVPAHEASAAKVCIAVKDDTLGLGASLKSRNVEHQRTGLDAFQGLLGRLNAKDEVELMAVEQKIENKKLAMFAQGRWGGMLFVPGGLLVQEDPRSTREPSADDREERLSTEDGEGEKEVTKIKTEKSENETPEERAIRKAEKRRQKEERRARKEAKRSKRSQSESELAVSTSETPDLTETETGASTPVRAFEMSTTSSVQRQLQNGRHILRGRNIQAKRMAFSDSKGLDQIFMRQQKQEA